MPTFPIYFGIQGDAGKIATMKGDIVSVLQAGCCVGALFVNFPSGNFNFNSSYIQNLMFILNRSFWS